MSMITLFLAKILGLYFVIVSIAMWKNRDVVKTLGTKIMENSPYLFLMGAYDVLFGLLIVLTHNVWVLAWPVIITVIGWIILLRGMLRLYFPDKMVSYFKRKSARIYHYLPVIAGVLLVLGLFLVVMGFMG